MAHNYKLDIIVRPIKKKQVAELYKIFKNIYIYINVG